MMSIRVIFGATATVCLLDHHGLQHALLMRTQCVQMDVPGGTEASTVVEMLVLQPYVVPDEATGWGKTLRVESRERESWRGSASSVQCATTHRVISKMLAQVLMLYGVISLW